MPNRRISDFPEDFDVEEIIVLGVNTIFDIANIKENELEENKRKGENEANIIIENIDNNYNGYIKLEIEKISIEELEVGDIFIINLIKDQKNDKLTITLKFLVKKVSLAKIEGYIIINDNETKLKSKAREEKLSLPILIGHKRKIQLSDLLLKSAFFKSINQYLHESKIKEIFLYKKKGNKKGIKGFSNLIKTKIGSLIGKK